VKLTEAQRRFLTEHLSNDGADGVLVRRSSHSRKPWRFVDRCMASGFVTIIDPDGRWPFSWTGTRITEAGRRALQGSTTDA
jgi:hypothetical protein